MKSVETIPVEALLRHESDAPFIYFTPIDQLNPVLLEMANDLRISGMIFCSQDLRLESRALVEPFTDNLPILVSVTDYTLSPILENLVF